jgi:cytochrome c553
MKTIHLLAPFLMIAACSAAAQPQPDAQPRAPGVEAPGYKWNDMTAEKRQALEAKGDAARGKVAFEACRGCHRSDASGRVDGSYPRLAGQYAAVLIKQMADVRAGNRDNWKMYPFVEDHVLTPQDMADIAVFLQGLPVPPEHGLGPGANLERGRELYARDCVSCHGSDGMGSAAKFYPRLQGQHYRYLLREAVAIRDGVRRNSNPDMVKAIHGYPDADVDAVSDYVSRLPAR